MALFQINYFSDILKKDCQMNVILPQKTQETKSLKDNILKDIPVIYLLHGMGGDSFSWIRYTNIERLVKNSAIAVVMPNADLSWYNNTNYGLNYFDAIALELPKIVTSFFPQISIKRDKNFIVGFSMGGYGAFKIALSTNYFGAAVSLSGAFNVDGSNSKLMSFGNKAYWENTLGSNYNRADYENNLINLAKNKVSSNQDLPKLFVWCGKQDFVYNDNKVLVNKFKSLGFNICYKESEGNHSWYYWDLMLGEVLSWLPFNYIKEI